MSKLGSNRDLVLFKGLGVNPHETCSVHVIEQDRFVLVGHILPVGIMFAVLAQQMVKITLLLMAAENHADANSVLESALIGQSF